MKYLVTGGSGFLGKAVTEDLLQKNHEVVVLDNLFRGKHSFIPNQNLEVIKGDIRDFNSVLKATKNVDSIIHLAFINGTKHFYNIPELVIEVGIKGMINVLEASKISGVSEIVLFSTSEVYQEATIIPTPEEIPLLIPDILNPRYSYGGSKAACELMLVHLGSKHLQNWKIIRPHNIYGKNMGEEHVIPNLISKIKKSTLNIEVQGSGLQTRSFCFIDDFKHGLNLILSDKSTNQIYNIGTMEEVTINDLTKLIMKIMGKELQIINTKSNKGETFRRVPDVSKLIKLGYKPKFSLHEGLASILR